MPVTGLYQTKMPIVLQLKSAQRKQDLDDISDIIQLIKDQNVRETRKLMKLRTVLYTETVNVI